MVVRAEIRAREHHPRHGAGELISLLCESCALRSLARLRVQRAPRSAASQRVGTSLDSCLTYKSYPCQAYHILNIRHRWLVKNQV